MGREKLVGHGDCGSVAGGGEKEGGWERMRG